MPVLKSQVIMNLGSSTADSRPPKKEWKVIFAWTPKWLSGNVVPKRRWLEKVYRSRIVYPDDFKLEHYYAYEDGPFEMLKQTNDR
jgi:hypothetical protein